jgi:hypothetical protein
MAAGSSPIVTFQKDPNAVLDYTLDWSDWLGDDTIVNSTWIVPVGIANGGAVYSSTTTTIWLSGGTAGISYSIYNQITTAGGRTEKRTFKVNALDR